MPDMSLLDSLITKLISVMCGHKSKIVSINHSTVGDVFTDHGVIGKIFVAKKYL